MAIHIYYCDRCSKHGEWLEAANQDQRDCPFCDAPMRMLPALPARVPVGKYGKGGGRGPAPVTE